MGRTALARQRRPRSLPGAAITGGSSLRDGVRLRTIFGAGARSTAGAVGGSGVGTGGGGICVSVTVSGGCSDAGTNATGHIDHPRCSTQRQRKRRDERRPRDVPRRRAVAQRALRSERAHFPEDRRWRGEFGRVPRHVFDIVRPVDDAHAIAVDDDAVRAEPADHLRQQPMLDLEHARGERRLVIVRQHRHVGLRDDRVRRRRRA